MDASKAGMPVATKRARRGATEEALIAEVIAEALRFCGPARPRDEMTLLVLERDA